MSFDNEINMFCDYMRNVKNNSEKTIRSYYSDLKQFFSAVSDKNALDEITKLDIERIYIPFLVESGNGASSRCRKLSSLSRFFQWEISNGTIVKNPVENVERPKIPQKKPKVMSKEDVKRVLDCAKTENGRESACEGFRNLAIIQLMFNTGIRREELTEIKLADINLSEGSILIHGKGNKERIVYFNDTVRAVISEYIVSHRNALKPAESSPYLFVSKRDKKLCVSTVNKIVNRYLQLAGIKEKGFTAHSTRKVFATTVYENTGDIFAVQHLLGHSSPSTTQRYVGAGEERKRMAAMTVNF